MSIINTQTNQVAAILQTKPSDTVQYLIRLLTETAVSKLVQNATRFMILSKSDDLELHHLEEAIKFSCLAGLDDSRVIVGEKEDQFTTFNQEWKQLQSEIKRPKELAVQGRWIMIDERVPFIEQNKLMKRMKRRNNKQNEPEKFNILHDSPLNFLMNDELQLFRFLNSRLQKDKLLDMKSSWKVINLIPFIMNTLMNIGPSDNRVKFLMQVIRSPSVKNSFEYHLHQIIAFLLEYQGKHSWEVGFELSKLINQWQHKYPAFHNVFGNLKENYSSKIKRLAYEVYFRVVPTISMVGVKDDVNQGNPEALAFVKLINMCWLRFRYQGCDYHEFYNEGRGGLLPDVYLESVI